MSQKCTKSPSVKILEIFLSYPKTFIVYRGLKKNKNLQNSCFFRFRGKYRKINILDILLWRTPLICNFLWLGNSESSTNLISIQLKNEKNAIALIISFLYYKIGQNYESRSNVFAGLLNYSYLAIRDADGNNFMQPLKLSFHLVQDKTSCAKYHQWKNVQIMRVNPH